MKKQLFCCHLSRFFFGTLSVPRRFVYQNGEEGVEIPSGRKKEIHEMNTEELQAEYRAARDDVEEKLKKYEGNKNYEIFVTYAKNRLAETEKNLKKIDALSATQIRSNLAALRNIIIFARVDEAKQKGRELTDYLEKKKTAALDRLKKRYQEHQDLLGDMPETWKLVQKLYSESWHKIGTLYNDRMQMAKNSAAKLASAKDINFEADTFLIYIDSIRSSAEANDPGSLNGEANAVYENYETMVKGSYLVEKGKQGNLSAEISMIYVDFLNDMGDKNPHGVRGRVLKLVQDYEKQLEGLSGSESYKQAAAIFSKFLDEYRAIRAELEPDNKIWKSRDYHGATIAYLDSTRRNFEKGWDKAEEVPEAEYRKAAFNTSTEYVVTKGVALHLGPEAGKEVEGLSIEYVPASSKVRVLDAPHLKANGTEYVKVQLLDLKGKPQNTGWIARNSISTRYGVKPEKGVEGGAQV